MLNILFFITIFLIGSIPFGLLIGRHWLKLDIRNEGSGNIGMTNVMRVGGKWAGIITFFLDFGTPGTSKIELWLQWRSFLLNNTTSRTYSIFEEIMLHFGTIC